VTDDRHRAEQEDVMSDDVTARVVAVAERGAALLDADVTALVVIDSADSVRLVNRAALDLLARPVDRLLGVSLHHVLVSHSDAAAPLPRVLRDVRTGAPWAGPLLAIPGEGDPITIDVAMSSLFGPSHHGVAIIGVDRRLSLFGAVGHLALHDSLTGLANRALLLDRLRQAAARAARSGTLVAAFFIDIDGFKRVNDTLGHFVGDQVLVETARELQARLRPTDTLARYGGDEMVAVCEVNDVAQLRQIARRLIATSPTEAAPGWPITVSIGGALQRGDGLDISQLLEVADAAMYHAKRTGEVELVVDLDDQGKDERWSTSSSL
jgi:diguanylate cyclase (GGDEF)-like protein